MHYCIVSALIRALRPQRFTSMLASVMASCLYCVPYHSSVLSVCPSNDFDTTATLQKEKSEQGQVTWTQKKKPRCQSWLGTLRLWPLHKMRCECFLLVLHLDRGGGSGDPSTRLPPTDEVCLEFLYIHSVLHLECVSRGTLDPYNHKLAGRFLFVNQQLEFNAKTKGILWCVIIISSPLMMQPNLLWLHLLSAGLRLMRKETPSWIQSSAGKTPRLNSHFNKEETGMQTVRVSQWVHAKSPPW